MISSHGDYTTIDLPLYVQPTDQEIVEKINDIFENTSLEEFGDLWHKSLRNEFLSLIYRKYPKEDAQLCTRVKKDVCTNKNCVPSNKHKVSPDFKHNFNKFKPFDYPIIKLGEGNVSRILFTLFPSINKDERLKLNAIRYMVPKKMENENFIKLNNQDYNLIEALYFNEIPNLVKIYFGDTLTITLTPKGKYLSLGMLPASLFVYTRVKLSIDWGDKSDKSFHVISWIFSNIDLLRNSTFVTKLYTHDRKNPYIMKNSQGAIAFSKDPSIDE